ncbi:MAG: hypothetical protein ABI763_07340, partial [Bacteroidota bacterium]
MKLHIPVPHELVAEQFTIVVPIEKLLPEGGTQVAVTAGTPPDGGMYVSVIPPGLLVASFISEGQLITGVSLTVKLNAQEDEPQILVAVHVTDVIAPTVNVEPDGGTQVTVAAGNPEVTKGAVHEATGLHCVMSAGHAPITGVVFTVTLNEHDELTHELVAVQVTA